jgi:hypothetical protein
MRRVIAVMMATLLVVVGFMLPAPAAAEHASVNQHVDGPFCGILWGSLPKFDAPMTAAPIVDVRAGRHECFDRLVVDVGPVPASLPESAAAGFSVRYVPSVIADPSGLPIPLSGGAFLNVFVRAPAHDVNGVATYAPADRLRIVDVAGFQTFRQVAMGPSFEGQTQFGLGVRARLPFRVFSLTGPGGGSRVVIDVAHQW